VVYIVVNFRPGYAHSALRADSQRGDRWPCPRPHMNGNYLNIKHKKCNFLYDPEISDRNVIFRERKTSARIPPADPVSLIIPEVQPLPHEPVVVKHRVNAFFGTDLEMILRAHDIDTLVLLGHATSGVIVSTVRYAADADYRLVVVEDGCAD